MVDRIYQWAADRHSSLIQAAHSSRVLNQARRGGVSIDVQRGANLAGRFKIQGGASLRPPE